MWNDLPIPLKEIENANNTLKYRRRIITENNLPYLLYDTLLDYPSYGFRYGKK